MDKELVEKLEELITPVAVELIRKYGIFSVLHNVAEACEILGAACTGLDRQDWWYKLADDIKEIENNY